jgi:phosphate transport system substrate-binding protein
MLTERSVKIAGCALLAAGFALAACGPANDGPSSGASGTVAISGAFALYPMVVRWTEEYNVEHPAVQFDVQAGGAGKGMSDVLAGAVDIAMVSREVRPEEADQGAVPIGVAKDAVLATVNGDNPALADLLAVGLTPDTGAAIWLSGEPITWGEIAGTENADEVHVYTRADAAGAAEMWALYIGGAAQEDLKGIAMQGDPGLAEAVRQDALGIGFNNLNFAYDPATGSPIEGLSVVPLDLNGDGAITPDEDFYATQDEVAAAIADGRYPSPPARVLYLVTKGEPSGPAADFIRWVLTDGQAFVTETGYVQLSDAQLQAGIDRLP